MTLRVALRVVCAAALVGFPAAALAQGSDRMRETVSVDRVVVDARVIEGSGSPVRGLSTGDFRVRVDGREVGLESAEWVSAAGSAAGAPAEAIGEEHSEEREDRAVRSTGEGGRLIVLFFQWDAEPSRMVGQLRMLRQAVRFLSSCGPNDRLAVLSFDFRLKLRQDFTADRAKVRRAIDRTILTDSPGRPDPADADAFSLARHFDFDAARRATLPEHALRVIGDALAGIPGPKSLLFFGWGIGNFDPGFGLILDHNYEPARRALVRAHTTVFSLDVTSADFHSLEGGLQALSRDTGGFYVKTHVFPAFAIDKVERAIAGYYVLVFVRPSLPHGHHRISVTLRRGHRLVLCRDGYDD